ncbi:MAG TPA: histone deacetylase family protein [Afipia sp.]
MSTLLLTHTASSLNHKTSEGHPERPDRIRAMEKALSLDTFKPLLREEAPMGDLETVLLAHSEAYVDDIRDMAPKEGIVYIDGDTMMSPGTWEAAMRGVGGANAGVDAVVSGKAQNVFVGTRPCGHHAEISRAMGFCIFNQAAIAARYAQKKHGISRVAVVDFYVHHGNGSQDIFWADPTVMYSSTHQMPLFPGTGAAQERGEHDTIVNAPLAPGDGGPKFRQAFEGMILPQLKKFAPELIIISAGFDAHWRDPLANIKLDEKDFGWATRQIMDVADESANGRIVSVLEGGYDLQGLHDSVVEHVTALMGH